MTKGETGRSFVIRIAAESRTEAILEFHKKHLTEHLWPRTLKQIKELANDERLYEVVEIRGAEEILVGLCYITQGQEPEPPTAERDEFGGVYTSDDCRGYGIASALGKIAISNHFAWDPPRGRLIAHVHEANELPRRVLQEQLGFVQNGQEIPPAEVVPENMKRNKDGQVVGHLFEFQRKTLLKFADWVENFSGTAEGPAGKSWLRIELPLITTYREAAVTALREQGKKKIA